jgi:hypothetical protein
LPTLYISEFSNLPFVSNGVIQEPDAATWIADQHVAIGGSHAESAGFNVATRYIVISADAVCSIAWTMPGATTNPATTSNLRVPANMPMRFGVVGGMKLSVIANS